MGRCYLVILISLCLLSCDKNEVPPKIASTDLSAVRSITIQTAVNLVNADTVSRLPIHYKIMDSKGNVTYYHNLEDKIKLYANGILQPNSRYISANQAQTITLVAQLDGLKSKEYPITARSPKTYPLVKLPLVFHIPKDVDIVVWADSLNNMIRQLNKIYRTQKDSLNPNAADSYIESYLATKDPNGKVLPKPGINRLDSITPDTRPEARILATNVLHEWCMKNYINIFMDVNFDEPLSSCYSAYSFMPPYQRQPYENVITCANFNPDRNPEEILPAIYIGNLNAPGIMAHELGHFLGLPHTFFETQYAYYSPYEFLLDIPKQEHQPAADGVNYDANGLVIPFSNVMGYSVPQTSFTHDQVKMMHHTIEHPYYLPL